MILSIKFNHVLAWIETEIEWSLDDLRNVVKNYVSNELDLVGFIKGYAYDVDIRRVVNPVLNLDFTFGIDTPCIVSRNKEIELLPRLKELQEKTGGPEGLYISRCLADLVSAMKHPDDTGFYCYRAIESLRQHCIHKFNLSKDNKTNQWKKIRELTKCSGDELRKIQKAAEPVRHGEVVKGTSEDRKTLFMVTWDIVDAYLDAI